MLCYNPHWNALRNRNEHLGRLIWLFKTNTFSLSECWLPSVSCWKVWKIRKKVDVIDFGCGYGYLALVLMPSLPEGSTYTGVDISEELINKGREIFKSLSFNYKFIISSADEVPEKEIKLNEMFRNRKELNLVYAAAMTFCFGDVVKIWKVWNLNLLFFLLFRSLQ